MNKFWIIQNTTMAATAATTAPTPSTVTASKDVDAQKGAKDSTVEKQVVSSIMSVVEQLRITAGKLEEKVYTPADMTKVTTTKEWVSVTEKLGELQKTVVKLEERLTAVTHALLQHVKTVQNYCSIDGCFDVCKPNVTLCFRHWLISNP